MGQRLMQPASDLFLGWLTGIEGTTALGPTVARTQDQASNRDFDLEALLVYAKACGWALARSHAKAGDAWTISGYLGRKDSSDIAMGRFALAYADQAEADHAKLKAAVRAGKVQVLREA